MEVNSRRGEVQMENIIISGFADEIRYPISISR